MSLLNNVLLFVFIGWIFFACICHGFSTNLAIQRMHTVRPAPSSRSSPFASVSLSLSQSKSPKSISDAQEEARRLREIAQRLKEEVQVIQSMKDAEAEAARMQGEWVQAEKLEKKLRYSVEIPVLKGDGSTVMERVDFPPRISNGKSKIITCQARLPLGLILGEHEEIPGAIRVDEVLQGGNGETAGVKVGDLLRAVTACQVTMETPTWQLLVGGIGQPKTKRFMFATDGRPFEQVMEAVASNRMDPEGRPAWLVLETVE